MTEFAVVHYRQFRHISQVCIINYHGQSCRKQQTNPEELKNDPLPLPTVVIISLYTGHFIIRGTFGVRQVTYAIKMKYFTMKNNFFSMQNE